MNLKWTVSGKCAELSVFLPRFWFPFWIPREGGSDAYFRENFFEFPISDQTETDFRMLVSERFYGHERFQCVD